VTVFWLVSGLHYPRLTGRAQASSREHVARNTSVNRYGERMSKAPSDLGEAGRELWATVTGSHELAPHLLVVLGSACRELDRAAAAEHAAAADPWQTDRYGAQKPHPGVAVARSSRLAAARLLRQLDLELPGKGFGPAHGGRLREARRG
jgi:hypothetical protein